MSQWRIGTHVLQSVVETAEFLRLASALLSEAEHGALIDYVAANPEAGVALGVIAVSLGRRK
jgi:hypothetical protein